MDSVNFTSVDLRNVNFKGVRFGGIKIIEANLENTNFEGTSWFGSMSGSSYIKADLSSVVGLTCKHIQSDNLEIAETSQLPDALEDCGNAANTKKSGQNKNN